ncbi:hypothetical protein [Niallia nealsonii]|uniref:Uncharacterized protein n=1 Tax=Niallia nealsonii TaxID=115979 RepID=A0A2N0Z7W3_9BACI|nr:hypothetical protein [Niallia nealsonii]PKG25606.1 hypothetical protein CWS01_01820 [Niallia nealsonii]
MEIRGSEGIGDRYIRSTFQSLVQAIIPSSLIIAKALGPVQVPGALELKVYKYVMWVLDHSIALPAKMKINLTSMTKSTVELLDLGAVQLVQTAQNVYPLHINEFPDGGPFSKLSPVDRLRALALLECCEWSLEKVSPPYQNNPGLIPNMIDVINQLTLFGFYSEWTGYGTTEQFSPEMRRVEYFPTGWILSHYPGPSFAYRDFRGFLAYMPNKKEKN